MKIIICRCPSLLLILQIIRLCVVCNGFQTSFTFRRRSNVSLQAGASDDRMPLVKGSFVALFTPFLENGDIDEESLRGLLRMHIEAGTDGLCFLGTTAEAAVMSMKERESALKIAVEEVKGKIPILVGTGTIDPVHVKEQTKQAMDLGADAALVVTPYYVKPPQRALIQMFKEVADIGLPVCVYNVPGRTACDITPETIAVLANEHPNIVAVKEATGDISRVQQIKQALANLNSSKELLLYSGDDATSADFVLEGGHGCISVSANLAPTQLHKIMEAALAGDVDTVKQLNDPLMSLHNDIFCESNPIPAKWAAKRIGIIPNATCRLPLCELDQRYYPKVEAALRTAGLIDS